MSNKKYIIITPFFPSNSCHGGSYVYDQVIALKSSRRYLVEVIKVISIFSNESDYYFQGIYVKVFKVIDFPFFILPGILNWINSVRIHFFFKKQYFYKNLSIVHAHVSYPSAYLANAISKRKKIKTIVQHHGIDALQLLNGRFNFITKLQALLHRVLLLFMAVEISAIMPAPLMWRLV